MSKFAFLLLKGVDSSSNYFDEDHHALLEKFNALYEANSSNNRELVLDATGALMEVAKEHFANEEQRMLESGYHAMGKHCTSHQKLLQSLADFHQKISLSQDFSTALSASSFLEQWLVPHLTNDDKRFSEFLSAREFLSKVGHP